MQALLPRSASGARGDFLGVNSCAPTSSHSPWECIYLPLVPRTWFAPGRGPLMGRICPRGGVGTSQVRLLLTGTRNMALKPPFSSLYCCSEVLRPLVVLPPPRSFLPMGIGGWHRRRLILTMPHPGDALSGQPVDFLPWAPWMGPTICLTLTLVNGRGRDGTEAF